MSIIPNKNGGEDGQSFDDCNEQAENRKLNDSEKKMQVDFSFCKNTQSIHAVTCMLYAGLCESWLEDKKMEIEECISLSQ